LEFSEDQSFGFNGKHGSSHKIMVKVHLDTDFGGDIDDLCALALLLRWPGVELAGITTVAEENGRRAGYVRYVLGLEGRSGIPVAAGAEADGGFYREKPGLPDEERYWPEPVAPAPGPVEEALRLLRDSIEGGCLILGVGPYTNLYLLDLRYPGILSQARLFLMGGYLHPPRAGFPAWGNEMDYNIQVDVKSAKHVIEHSYPTLIPLTVTVETYLRRASLDSLRDSGALGRLIVRQAEAFEVEYRNETTIGATCPGLPRDIINFQHDPLACAIALGWKEGVEIEEALLVLEVKDGWLTERTGKAGYPARVVTKVDGRRFSEFWLNRVAH
jgi:inosine-uridine nucleoside N-ribohydrolase